MELFDSLKDKKFGIFALTFRAVSITAVIPPTLEFLPDTWMEFAAIGAAVCQGPVLLNYLHP